MLSRRPASSSWRKRSSCSRSWSRASRIPRGRPLSRSARSAAKPGSKAQNRQQARRRRREGKWKRGKRSEVAQPMGWDRGFYYRVRKVNGRVVREYVGRGPVAELVAQMDALERKQREAERAAWLAKRAEMEALDASLDELNDLADLLAHAALLAAGFRRHKRGEWRKRREQDRTTC